ncbi:hypothetical protein MFIFM68171_06466 [Madurella fahalii]|uniref:Amidohydrolase 3 domain-containing protein n=1 Tax=Madurella fahalii TaxID=1157608 RepID=A0ABQ0GET1_9PEZI
MPAAASSPPPPATRRGLRLSLLAAAAAGGVALALNRNSLNLNLQQHIPILGPWRSQSPIYNRLGDGDGDDVQTYCYQSVRTAALLDGAGNGDDVENCFSVSASKGTFTRVFAARSSSGDEGQTIRPGHVIPGLWDGHGHLIPYGEFLHSADLFGATSPAEVRDRLAEYLASRSPDEAVGTRSQWARGVGWDQMLLGGMPTADMLEEDERLRGKYFMLDRVDVHCTWVSRAVLDLLPEDLPDVPGGEIVRTPGMGVFCDNAIDLVTALWPKPDKERKKRFVKSAMRELHKVGLVGMHDAGTMPKDIAMYEEMSRTEDWTLRVYAMIECDERNTFCPEKAVKVEREDGMLSVRSVKLFADGALGSWGSALIKPYTDRPDTSGSLLVNASTLTSLARSWATAGFQVNIHAIGDLANRLAIDALEAALKDLCPDETEDLSACQSRHRFRIEHAQIIHPDDQERMHKIGIIPSIQPTHATSDMAYAERRLGEERTRTEAYRMRSLLDISPVLGSDFPVEPPNPFEGMYAAVTRKNPHTGVGPPGYEGGWHVEEALNMAQALEGFTRGAARGAFLEGKAGVIKEGAFADWVVLDYDIGEVDKEKLRHMKVRETWVGGKMVYQTGDEAGSDGGSEVKEDFKSGKKASYVWHQHRAIKVGI